MSFNDLLDLDANKRVVIEPIKDPELAAAMTPRNAGEQEARDSAIKLSTLAVNYYAHVHNPYRVLEAAQDKLDTQKEIRKVLEKPEEALKVAQYLQTLHAVGQTEHIEVPLTDRTAIYLPSVYFSKSDDKTISEICFSRGGGSNKFGEIPYEQVCATKDSP